MACPRSWATGAVRSCRPWDEPVDPPALIGPGSAAMPVKVKLPASSVTVEDPSIETGMPARGLPFSSTTWPETSVDDNVGSVTVTGSTIVPERDPLETATEKSVVPAWPGAGAKMSSPVSRLKLMLAGSGWGVMG